MIFDQSILPFPKCILPSFPSLSTVSLYNFPFHFLSVVQSSLPLIQLSLPLSLIFPSLKFLPFPPLPFPQPYLNLPFPPIPFPQLSLPTTFLFLFLSLPLVQFFSSLPKNLPFPKIHLLPLPLCPFTSPSLPFPFILSLLSSLLPLPLCPFTSPSLPFPFIMFLFPFLSSLLPLPPGIPFPHSLPCEQSSLYTIDFCLFPLSFCFLCFILFIYFLFCWGGGNP